MAKRKKTPKTKRCPRCEKRKSVKAFHKNKHKSDGLQSWCSECTGNRIASWRACMSESDPIGFWARESLPRLRARARRKGLDCSLSTEDLMDLYSEQGGVCAISGVAMTMLRGDGRCGTNISVDRIDSTRGYVVGNVRLVCDRANTMRSDMSDVEMIWWCQQLVDNCTVDMDTVTDHAAPIEPLGDIDIHGDY